MNLSTKALAVAIGIAAFTHCVYAGPISEDKVIRGQAVVRYGDLNLNNERARGREVASGLRARTFSGKLAPVGVQP